MTTPRRLLARARADERGSVPIETVIIVPAVILLLALVVAGARLAMAHDAVENTAGAAARAASIARTASQAQADAATIAASSLATGGLTCTTTSVQVDTSGFATPVGQPATVTVSVACAAPLSDLLVPGLGGSKTITATQSSPLDRYRERAALRLSGRR